MKKIAVLLQDLGQMPKISFEFFQKTPLQTWFWSFQITQVHWFWSAKALDVDTFIFNKTQLLDPKGVLSQLLDYKIDFIVLAGFLWKFPEHIIIGFSIKL